MFSAPKSNPRQHNKRVCVWGGRDSLNYLYENVFKILNLKIQHNEAESKQFILKLRKKSEIFLK